MLPLKKQKSATGEAQDAVHKMSGLR